MKLLLDTHILLWAAGEPECLSHAARTFLLDTQHRLHFSAASLWEITIKHLLGRADFKVDARLLRRGLLDNGYHELAISSDHAILAASLPPLHKDPFDRILLAQAMHEGMLLLTADTILAQYEGPIQQV